MESSWVYDELKVVRNSHASFHWGILPGLALTGLSSFVFRGKEPWTITNNKTDAQKTELASKHSPIEYPKPDGKLSFDLLSNLTRSGTNHADQPSHLRIKPDRVHVAESVSLEKYAGPEQRFCPAKVYEYLEDASGKKSLVINAQNCVHCKTCSIKTPEEFIDWTVPEGGGGPSYEAM
jgi:electron-transferring-flavoprotein dehydrogenase